MLAGVYPQKAFPQATDIIQKTSSGTGIALGILL
jgi:hypothetical protein